MTETQLQRLLDHADYIVSQDETELALKALELVPGRFRDEPPQKLLDMRRDIQAAIETAYDLMKDSREMPKTVGHSVAFLQGTARGQLLRDELKKANDAGINPHIVDMGPGDFCFAIGLSELGHRFSYEGLTLNLKAYEEVKKVFLRNHLIQFADAPVWFVAYEIIEHLSDINEIMGAQARYAPKAEKIFLSTPKYTYGRGTPEWRKRGIHHRRTYTPGEFYRAAISLFPGRQWSYVDNEVMCLFGT